MMIIEVKGMMSMTAQSINMYDDFTVNAEDTALTEQTEQPSVIQLTNDNQGKRNNGMPARSINMKVVIIIFILYGRGY